MKLDCDWLASSMASPFGELSSEVRFNKCYVWHPTVPTSTFINWNLSHCTQLEISLITDEPECETICKMIGNAGKASFMFSDRVKVLDVFQNFLREIARDRSSVKNLCWFQLHHMLSNTDPIWNLPELIEIYKGEIHVRNANGPFTNTFLKCPVGHGVAVICYDASILIDIYIRDEDNRETLLECLYDHMFCDIPFDASAVFQQFVEAPTDTLAFDLLCESYPTNF